MKQSVFDNIKEKLILLKSSIVYTFQIDTAYRANNIATILSTVILAITMILFAVITFSEGKSIAGYTKDEMLLFSFLGMLNFMINNYVINPNIRGIVEDVNTGALDFILIRPVPGLFYLLTRRLSIVGLLRDTGPGLLLSFLVINFANIHASPFSILLGIISIVCGQLCIMYFQLMACLPVFWFGESSSLFDLTYVFDYRLGRFIPFEAVAPSIQLFFTSIIPVMIGSGVSTSLIIGKSDPIIILYVAIITLILITILNLVWKRAIRSYTSASS